MTTLLGPNNHGKSNLLAAVEFFLSPGMKIVPNDFCSARQHGDTELYVEVTFAALTEQERTTFRKYMGPDGNVRIRKSAALTDLGNVEIGYRGYVVQPRLWWLQETAAERLRTREAVTELVPEVPALQTILDTGGRITKERILEFQAAYISDHRNGLEFEEALEESPLLGVKNIAGGVLPDFYLIPAVRDLGDEMKTTGSATFSRLLQRAVSEMTARDPRFAALEQGLAELVDGLNARPDDRTTEPSSELDRLERAIKAELSQWKVGVSIRVTAPEVRRVFELGTDLVIDDGFPTVAERKGHGLQRAVMFSLIRAWASTLRNVPREGAARARAASESLVFAYEEPELFLHPQAQRTLAESLNAIAETPEHQVLLCTHSAHFIDLENYRSIAIVHRPDVQVGTQVKQCTSDLFAGEGARERKRRFHMASWINPDRGELFFARKVVLVEGETEKTILPYLADRLGHHDRQISVIDCGSKHNLPLYLEVLNAFGIEYIVVHDEDPVPDPLPADWNEAKAEAKRRTYALNDEIRDLVRQDLGSREMIQPDLEHLLGVPLRQGERKGKALAALDHFSEMITEEVPGPVADLVRRIFATP
jgi:putative ATP-dependent endonuclease of the OLD family